MNLKTSSKRKRKASTPSEESVPELPDQIVQDILVRLPVKSLLRCRAVCKAWRAIISHPFFTQAHLRWSASRCEQNPCLIITPHTLKAPLLPGEEEEGWPTNFSNHIRFYRWQQGASMATFMHAEDFHYMFSFVRNFAHCDGLVLAPTDTGIFLFNPATRETAMLPVSIRDHEEVQCCCVGLGRDPRSGEYKVAQAFYRSWDPDTGMGTGMRMEVLTVSGNGGGGGAVWREIADDLPYPACNWRTAVTVDGFLFWRVARHLPGPPPWGLIHLSLADERFGVTRLPDSVDPVRPDAFALDELHGELCVSELTDDETVTVWTLAVQGDGVRGQCWEQRCVVKLGFILHPLAFLPGGRIMVKGSFNISIYDMATAKLTTVCQMDRLKYQGRGARPWKNLFTFNAHRYTESLVRITV